MPRFSQAHQEELLMIVIDYLHKGSDVIKIKENLQNLRDKQKEKRSLSGRMLCELTPINATENKRFIRAILGNLGLSDEEQAQYLAKRPAANLYQLLSNLYNDDPVRYNHLRRLLVEINQLKPPRNWALISSLGALLSAAVGAALFYRQDYAEIIENWAHRTMPTIFDWLSKTFSLLRNLPILGMVLQSIGLAWAFITTFANSTNNTEYKLSRLFFKTLAASLSIGAYALMYLAAGLTTPLAAGLFIASSAIGLLKSLYTLFQTRSDYVDPTTLAQTYEHIAANERVGNMLTRNRRTFGVQFLAAALTTAAVATMCILPPSLIIFLSCMAFMILVEQVRSTLTANIHDTCDIELQERIHQLTATLDRDERLYPLESRLHQEIENQRNHAAANVVQKLYLATKERKLNQKIREVTAKEKELASREEMCILNLSERLSEAYQKGMKDGVAIAFRQVQPSPLVTQSIFPARESMTLAQNDHSLSREDEMVPHASPGSDL